MIIYLISGLGADERIFENLDFKNYETKHIKWIEPKKEDTIAQYVAGLIKQIETKNPIILGVSFGGMIAVEIAKQIDCAKIILVSSAKTKYEIPILYRLIGKTNFHKLIPVQIFKQVNFITYWFFGMKTQTEKSLLKTILLETNDIFLKWAINAIIQWDNQVTIERLIHIQGDKDRILPFRNIKHLDYVIKNGGHLMVYNMANDINKILDKILNKIPNQ